MIINDELLSLSWGLYVSDSELDLPFTDCFVITNYFLCRAQETSDWEKVTIRSEQLFQPYKQKKIESFSFDAEKED